MANTDHRLICPICYEASIERILQDVPIAACIDKSSYTVREFAAFSCVNGHVFLVMSHYADAAKTESEPPMIT